MYHLHYDGLRDCLTSEEVVGLVGVWLKKNPVMISPSDSSPAYYPADPDIITRKERHLAYDPNSFLKPIVEREDLPVLLPKEDTTVMYRYWRANKRFLNVDTNLATHLVRNALGGADRDLTAALLKINAPRSRRFRDDIGVQVLIFD